MLQKAGKIFSGCLAINWTGVYNSEQAAELRAEAREGAIFDNLVVREENMPLRWLASLSVYVKSGSQPYARSCIIMHEPPRGKGRQLKELRQRRAKIKLLHMHKTSPAAPSNRG